jgi:hypothetical protein
MRRARHLIPLMAAGALASLLAWPAGAVRATELLTITTAHDSRIERVDWRPWRDDDPPRRYRYRFLHRNYDDHFPFGYGYRYGHPYGYYYPYAYDYYRPHRGFGFYGPGFVFEFGHRRRWHDDD